MKNTQTACFALIASAFLLAGILIVRVDEKSQPNTAQADMVIAQPSFTMLTARTQAAGNGANKESLFILENSKGVLVVYDANVGRKQLEPILARKMSTFFGK